MEIIMWLNHNLSLQIRNQPVNFWGMKEPSSHLRLWQFRSSPGISYDWRFFHWRGIYSSYVVVVLTVATFSFENYRVTSETLAPGIFYNNRRAKSTTLVSKTVQNFIIKRKEYLVRVWIPKKITHSLKLLSPVNTRGPEVGSPKNSNSDGIVAKLSARIEHGVPLMGCSDISVNLM